MLIELKPYFIKKLQHHNDFISKHEDYGTNVRKLSTSSYDSSKMSSSNPTFIRENMVALQKSLQQQLQLPRILESENNSEFEYDMKSEVSSVTNINSLSRYDGDRIDMELETSSMPISRKMSKQSDFSIESNSGTKNSSLFRIPKSVSSNSKARKSKYTEPIGILEHTENSITMYR